MAKPIQCFVAGNKGYVWDADGAMQLRKKHRIMGCLVGSVAQFKNQNEVNYLPLELSADEVTLAAQQGWVELFPETSAPVRALAAAAATAAAAARAAAAAAATAAAAAAAAGGDDGNGGSGGGRPMGRRTPFIDPDWEAAYQEYYAQYDPQVGFTGRYLPVFGAKRRQLLHPAAASPQQQQQQTGGGEARRAEPPPGTAAAAARHGDGSPEPTAAAAAAAAAADSVDQSEPVWRAAVTEGGPLTLPLTAAAALTARSGGGATAAAATAEKGSGKGTAATCAAVGGSSSSSSGVAAADGTGPDGTATAAAEGAVLPAAPSRVRFDGGVARVGWSYPGTAEERLRFAVFCDLHRQGFMMTGGIKFGSDLLAYPGDPSLYHAQFTVRPVPPGGLLNPMVLKAVARGSHAARKHLLLATYQTEEEEDGEQEMDTNAAGKAGGGPPRRIKYMSFAPEAGFGSKA